MIKDNIQNLAWNHEDYKWVHRVLECIKNDGKTKSERGAAIRPKERKFRLKVNESTRLRQL